MDLTKEKFENFIDRLKYHNRGAGVDDHCTANPIFIVQSLKKVGGIDLDYDPEYYWTDEAHEQELSDDELMSEIISNVEDGCSFNDFDINSDNVVTFDADGAIAYQKIGFAENWEYVCAHLTREGAEAFIQRKKHDHRELRIYVDSQYWCWEFNAIINGMLDGRVQLVDPS